MPEANTVFDENGNIIAVAKFGLVWLKNPRTKLAGYDYGDNGYVYSVSGEKTAHFEKGIVKNLSGDEMGKYQGYKLFIGNKFVGKCIGCDGVAAAALVYIFSHVS